MKKKKPIFTSIVKKPWQDLVTNSAWGENRKGATTLGSAPWGLRAWGVFPQ
jgi:hypothetical protein